MSSLFMITDKVTALDMRFNPPNFTVVELTKKLAASLNTHTRYLHENVVQLSEKIASKMPGNLNVCMFVCTGT